MLLSIHLLYLLLWPLIDEDDGCQVSLRQRRLEVIEEYEPLGCLFGQLLLLLLLLLLRCYRFVVRFLTSPHPNVAMKSCCWVEALHPLIMCERANVQMSE